MALDHPEDPGEEDACEEGEHAEPERKRDVGGAETDHEQKDHARTEPCHGPGQAHADRTADTS